MPQMRMIALDLDGTALLNDGVHFAPGALAACTAAAEAGVAVVVCTGRPRACLPPGLPHQPWLSYAILSDGAEVWDFTTSPARLLWQRPIARRSVAAVLRLAKENALAAEAVDAAGHYYMTPEAWHRMQGLLRTGAVSPFHQSVLEQQAVLYRGAVSALPPISKINLFAAPAALEPILQKMPVRSYFCAGRCTEIVALRAGKLAAARSVARALGCTMAEVAALGDSANDAPLLAAAGYGIAMGNAPAAVAALANATTAKNTAGGAAAAILSLL